MTLQHISFHKLNWKGIHSVLHGLDAKDLWRLIFTSKNNICNVYLAICKYRHYVNRSYNKDVNMAECVRFDQGGVTRVELIFN